MFFEIFSLQWNTAGKRKDEKKHHGRVDESLSGQQLHKLNLFAGYQVSQESIIIDQKSKYALVKITQSGKM